MLFLTLPGGKLVDKVMEGWRSHEKATKTVQKGSGWLTDCVLKEVAITRMGGEKFFHQAVQRGAIKRLVKGLRWAVTRR